MSWTFKNPKTLFPILVLVLLIAGCLPSYYPLFYPDQRIIESELYGTWQSDGGIITFEADTINNENRYLMTQISTSGDTALFYADLGKLGDYYFLDLSLRELELGDTWAGFHIVPVHTFSKIQFDNDKLRIAMYDEGWLKKRIKQRQIRIKYEEKPDGNILLTAPTEELQKFAVKYAEEDQAFMNADPLERVTDQ